MSIGFYFAEGPNGPIAVADVDHTLLMDKGRAATIRKRLSAACGGAPVLLRCCLGETVLLDGPEHLFRYAFDAELQSRPLLSASI